jgi:hypothetical protein
MTPEQALRRIIEIEALPPDPLLATEWRRLHEIAFDARPGDAEARVFRELALRQALDLSEMLDDAGVPETETMSLSDRVSWVLDERDGLRTAYAQLIDAVDGYLTVMIPALANAGSQQRALDTLRYVANWRPPEGRDRGL